MRRLAELYPDERIAETLNGQGRLSARGKPFSRGMVASLRHRHGIAVFRAPGDAPPGDAPPGDAPPALGVREAARELGTTASTLYRWIRQGFVPAEPAAEGAAVRVRLTAAVRERFCETAPPGYARAGEACRALGLSRQALRERIRDGALEAKRIPRGPGQGLYVKWEREPLPLLEAPGEEARDG